MSLSTFYTTQAGQAAQGVSLNNTRRTYDFGNRIAHLSTRESAFMTYLMALSKQSTPDPIFKHLERRDQWQRRRFQTANTITGVTVSALLNLTGVKLASTIDKYGRELEAGTTVPTEFILPEQTLGIVGQLETAAASGTYADARLNVRVAAQTATGASDSTYTLVLLAVDGDTDYATTFAGRKVRTKVYAAGGADANKEGLVIGSAFAEATGAPEGWVDELYDREGYTQIFKTSVPLMSGSAQATVHRGIPSEWARVYSPKMKEHKLDLTRAMLFNVGGAALEGSQTLRYTNGLIPYLEKYGIVETGFSYASTTYDSIMEFFRWFLDPERGIIATPLAFTSRKVIAWLNKLGDDGFLHNSVTASAYQIQVGNRVGRFGHQITEVWTPFGSIAFTEETQLKGPYEDYLVITDPSKLRYRPLAGNGVNRDTRLFTNVQDNDIDGRKDLIMTEAGLQIDLPECHAVWKFS